MTITETEKKVLESALIQKTICEVNKETGIKYPNLSKTLKTLRERDLIIDVGRYGYFKVVKTNKSRYAEVLAQQIESLEKEKQKVVENG